MAAQSMSLTTHNPGLGKYVARVSIMIAFLTVIIFFAGVHLYYATSALLDLITLLILFFCSIFFALSVVSLVMAARVGPGELPSRFTAVRMETFIRNELKRIMAKAQHRRSQPSADGTASLQYDKGISYGLHCEGGAVASSSSGGAVTTISAPQQGVKQSPKAPNWSHIDAAEGQELANAVSTAAIKFRRSQAAEEEAQERAAVEARLHLYNVDGDTISDEDHWDLADDTDRDVSASNAGDVGSDAEMAAPRAPPAYMTEAMQLRRLRKLRHGLELVQVSQAAQRVIDAIEGTDLDRKQEEMSFLIPGANWCRYCNFYQMNDTRHCRLCDRCVYRSKLHCVCCAQCIGYANSKYYVLFLFYLGISFILADVLDCYLVSWGYTFFFKETGESNSVFYLVFVYTGSFAVVCVGILSQYLYATGRGVGLLTDLLRQQREEQEAARISNRGEQYQPIFTEPTMNSTEGGSASPAQETPPFSWRRAMDTIGEGLPLPLWFWLTPTQPLVKEIDDPPGFWDTLREAIRMRLRSVADEDDAFSDDDHVEGGALNEAVAPSAPAASLPFAGTPHGAASVASPQVIT